MAFGIGVVYSIKNTFPESNRFLLQKAPSLPIVLFSGLKKSPLVTLNKQLNWGLKIVSKEPI